MRHASWPALLVAGLCLTACSKVDVQSSLNPDGGVDRKTTFTVTKDQMSLDDKDKALDPADSFSIPAAGAGLTVNKQPTKDGVEVVVSRHVPASQPLTDVTLLAKGKVPFMTSGFTVTKLPNGQLEYLETLKWAGPRDSAGLFDSADGSANFKKAVTAALPASLATPENEAKAAVIVTESAARALLGPPRPILGDALLTPGALKHELAAAIFPVAVPELVRQLPGLSAPDAESFLKKLLPELEKLGDVQDKAKNSTDASKPGSDPATMTPFSYSLAFPGKVVETNGLVDPLTGELYWSLMAASVQVKDIQLRAVVDPKGG